MPTEIPVHIRRQINRWSEGNLIWLGVIVYCYPEVLEPATKEQAAKERHVCSECWHTTTMRDGEPYWCVLGVDEFCGHGSTQGCCSFKRLTK